MDYEKFFEQKLADLHDEGRYRVFATLSASAAARRQPSAKGVSETM